MSFKRLAMYMMFTVLLLNATPCHAGRIDPLQGLEALRKGFAGINDFSAEITQEKWLTIMKRKMVMNGSILFRKPGLFLMQINPPYATRMLLSDNVVEQVTGKREGRSRIVLPPEQSLNQWFAKLAKPVTTLPEGFTVRAEQNGSLYTLVFTPQNKRLVKELTIVFQDDGTIRSIVIDEQNGDRAKMSFKKVRRNIGLTEKDFRLD